MSIATSKIDAHSHCSEHPFDAFRNVRSAIGALLPCCGRARTRLVTGSAHKQILVVEDDADSAQLLRRLLERHQFTVAVAGCAEEARRACADAHFDMVVCDIGLPDENGWSLMKDLGSRYDVKGIALTAYVSPADYIKSRDAGFIAHLSKPLQIDLLLSAIHEVDKRAQFFSHTIGRELGLS